MDAFKQLEQATKDAEREWIERGADQAKAEADAENPPNECPCCIPYNRPGTIYNAGQWISCPMCNAK